MNLCALTIDEVEPISLRNLFRRDQIEKRDIKRKLNYSLSDEMIEDNEYIFISNLNKEIEVMQERLRNTIADLRNMIKSRFFARLEQISIIGDDWIEDDGIKGPNEYVIEFSKALIERLVDNNLFPIRITPTVEEGLCFVFEEKDNTLYLELYNDKDIGYIIENTKRKEIIANEDLFTCVQIIETVSIFFNYSL